ncbi:TPA: hypothetical protein DIC40_07545 [Patescibacteria group bacterium]|nr:hypothetical protein [Candidatus Gracilibacteria bacterium]
MQFDRNCIIYKYQGKQKDNKILLFITLLSMLTAKESSEMLKNMSASERLEALKHKVGEKTRDALDAKIRETVAAYEKDISIVLKSDICTDKDKDIS